MTIIILKIHYCGISWASNSSNSVVLLCVIFCLFSAEEIAKGTYDKSDSTNLYIGNINPKVNNNTVLMIILHGHLRLHM